MENIPFYVKTDSLIGSGDEAKVLFKSNYNSAAGLLIKFSSPTSYKLKKCTQGYKDFVTALPTSPAGHVNDKYWRLSLTRGSGTQKL